MMRHFAILAALCLVFAMANKNGETFVWGKGSVRALIRHILKLKIDKIRYMWSRGKKLGLGLQKRIQYKL